MSLSGYPKISIVTPSYNQGRFLEETILSVIDQNYPNLEYIIIDGGSADNSVDIIKKYEKHLAYWVSEKDNGQTHAINKGFSRASGEILNWLNSDDMLSENALQLVAEETIKNPSADFFYGDFKVIDNSGKEVFTRKSPPYNFYSLIYGRQLSCQPAVFFRKRVLDKIGYLDESLKFCMDIEFWIRAAINKSSFCQILQPLAIARMHPDAKTSLMQHTLYQEHKDILKKYKALKIPPAYIILNRFWRYFAAASRFINRKDRSFLMVSKTLKQTKQDI